MKKLKSYRFDDATVELIEEMRKELHLSNNSDVLRRSLRFLKLVADNKAAGGTVAIKHNGCSREIIL